MEFTRGYALLVGVDEYTDSPQHNLPVARADVEAVAAVLRDGSAAGYPADQVVVLTGPDARREGILGALQSLRNVPQDSTVFIFFCGHALLGDDGGYYFLSSDTRFDDGQQIVRGSAVSAEELVTSISMIDASKVLVVFNSSFSGIVTGQLLAQDPLGDGGPGGETTPPPADMTSALLGPGEGRVLMAACRRDQFSYFTPDAANTVFTEALVRGLQGAAGVQAARGYIGIFELYEYVYQEVKSRVKQLGDEIEQDPVLAIREAVGPFPVALYRGGLGATLGYLDSDLGLQSKPRRGEVEVLDAGDWRGNMLPAFNPDTPLRGAQLSVEHDDWLEVGRDVTAFAMLIASNKVVPPLSIGLFGEWGSGKSFFMQLLKAEVTRLAAAPPTAEATAGVDLPPHGTPYYKHIRQVEFNAWQYMEGNLWASLVAHIFDALIDEDQTNVVDVTRARLMDTLGVAREAERQALKEEKQAREQLAKAQEELVVAEAKFRQEQERLLEVTPANMLAAVLSRPEFKQILRMVRAKLGLDPLMDEAESAYAETRAALQRGQSLLVFLGQNKQYLWWLALAPVLAILGGLLIGWFSNLLGTGWFAETAALIGSIGAFVTTLLVWLMKPLRWLAQQMDTVEAARKDLDTAIMKETAGIRREIEAQKDTYDQARSELESKRKGSQAAQQKVAEAERKLQEATPVRILENFLAERVDSTDYRKHLGLLALIRKDFKTLSDLIDAQNREPAEIPPGDGQQVPPPRPINRIVLYIDDLDRCPPQTVVRVLQAVNLLLGLPLFVVVVAVDSRWVRGALLSRYSGLLLDEPKPAAVQDDGAGSQATWLDYLEKIFQIAFWLSPVSKRGRVKMLTKLLTPHLVTIPTGGSTEASGATSDFPTQGTTVAPPSPELHGAPRQPLGSGAAFESRAPEQKAGLPQNTPLGVNPTALMIEQAEFDFIEKLSPLLGRSPRALKRFVNTYMLIKARLTAKDEETFLKTDSGAPEFKIVLVLLALVTNNTLLSPQIFRAVDHLAGEARQDDASDAGTGRRSLQGPWQSILQYIDENSEKLKSYPDWAAEWKAVQGWLGDHESDLETDWARLDKWVRRIARYAYVAEPSWLS